MMDSRREKGFLYPQVDVIEWGNKYGLLLNGNNCLKCDAPIEFTIPVAWKKWRGVVSNHTSCGKEYVQSKWIVMDVEFNKNIGKLFDSLNPDPEIKKEEG